MSAPTRSRSAVLLVVAVALLSACRSEAPPRATPEPASGAVAATPDAAPEPTDEDAESAATARTAAEDPDGWRAVGLTLDQAAGALGTEPCAADARTFRACVNAIRRTLREADPGLEVAVAGDDADPRPLVARFGPLEVRRSDAPPSDDRHARAQALGRLVAALEALYADPSRRDAIPWSDAVDWIRREHATDGAESRLTAAMFNGYLATAADPFTHVSPAEREDEEIAAPAAERVGTGLFLEARDGALVVHRVVVGSPAHDAGLRAGATLVAIDDVPVTGWSAEAAEAALAGEAGAPVSVTVRLGDATTRHVIVRRPFAIPWVLGGSVALGDDVRVAYVGVPTLFRRSLCDEATRLVERAERADVDAFVLDLRGDAGGLLDQAACLAGLFLPEGSVLARFVPMAEEAPGAAPVTQKTSRAPVTTRPLVVLVDHLTGSAAELVAGAVRDHGRGLVVGTRTYGKGTVQVAVDAGQPGLRRWVTAGGWRRAGGRDVHLAGVTPDVRGVVAGGAEAADAPGVELMYLDALTTPIAPTSSPPTSPATSDATTRCARRVFDARERWSPTDASGADSALSDPVAWAVALAACASDAPAR